MSDLRVRRTRLHLRDALMSLMQEKPYETISVTEITERAMVNRATFYRHYEDKSDLFERGISEMLEEVRSIMEPVPHALEDYEVGELPKNATVLLDHVKANRSFYKLMLGPNGVGEFVSRFRAFLVETYSQRARTLVNRYSVAPRVPLIVLAHMWAGDLVGLISWWVQDDCAVPEEDVASFMVAYVVLGTYSTMSVPAPKLKEEFLESLEQANVRAKEAFGID